METSTLVAIITSQHNNQTPLFYATINQGKTKLHLAEETISQTQPDKLVESLKSLEDKLNKFIEKDEDFKRKLTLEISRIRESNSDLADQLDRLIWDWNNL